MSARVEAVNLIADANPSHPGDATCLVCGALVDTGDAEYARLRVENASLQGWVAELKKKAYALKELLEQERTISHGLQRGLSKISTHPLHKGGTK